MDQAAGNHLSKSLLLCKIQIAIIAERVAKPRSITVIRDTLLYIQSSLALHEGFDCQSGGQASTPVRR